VNCLVLTEENNIMKKKKRLCVHAHRLLHKNKDYFSIDFNFLPVINFSYDSDDLKDGTGAMLTFEWLFWQISFWIQYDCREY